MVAPEGTKVDADSFELQRQGNRVCDFEAITMESNLFFVFLGPEEGPKRAERDAAAKEATQNAWEEERRRQDWRRHQEQEREAARAREREQEEKEKEPPKPVVEVEVTVKHAMENMASSVTVKVMSNCTILDLRHAVMAAIGETKLSEVKLVKRWGGALTSWKNEAEIGERREFLSMGRKLTPVGSGGEESAEKEGQAETEQPQPPGDVWLKITSVQDGGFRSVQMVGTRTVRELKAHLCEEAKRSFVAKVKLSVSGSNLRDSEKLSAIPESEWDKVLAEGIDLGPPKEVSVTVTHCHTQHTLNLTVLDTITIRNLRQHVSEKAECELGEAKIVRRLLGGGNGGWSSISDTERLNGRTEFFCMGKALERPPPGPGPMMSLEAPVFEDREISVSICLDCDLGISHEVPVKLGSSIRVLKEMLAAGDPTHRTKPEDVGLVLSSAPDRLLPDSVLVTEEYMKLNLVPAGGQQEEEHEADATGYRWTAQGAASVKDQAERYGSPSAGTPFTDRHLDVIREDPQWSWVDHKFLLDQHFIEADGPVELRLTHALDGTETTVQVLPTATILEVRRAVMLAIGQMKLSEVKLLAKGEGGDFEPLEDGDSLAGRRELYTVGCSLG